MEFKEFLKENKVDTRAFSLDGSVQDYLPKKALGEWAWSYLVELLNNHAITTRVFYEIEKYLEECCEFNGINPFEIVVACLGEAEIKKRLKEMK